VEENVVDARLGEIVDRLGDQGGHVMGFEKHSSIDGLAASSNHAAVRATHRYRYLFPGPRLFNATKDDHYIQSDGIEETQADCEPPCE
jgi:hypothetical protein